MKKAVILMSSYNGGKYIGQQIDSILRQTYENLDLFIRDDGSTDNTLDIISSYHDRVKWYTGENLRSAGSFMELLCTCGDYDYYAFSDQDDVWDSDKIEIAINELAKYNKPALYYCNSRLVDADGKSYETLNYKRVESKCVERIDPLNSICCGGIMGCTMVVNHELVTKIRENGYPKKMIMHDSFVETVCAAIGGTIICDGRPHMDYRQHSNNVIGRKPGIANALKYRWKYLMGETKYSVADQCNDILKLYKKVVSSDGNRYLKLVARYKKNWLTRIRLASSRDFHFNSIKNAMFIRLSIIMGKR